MKNRYILLLNSNFDHEKYLFEVLNESCDPGFYRFRLEVPETMRYGEYDWLLFRCSLPYDIVFSHNLIDSLVTVVTADGTESTWTLRDLRPESGILQYRPDDESPVYDQFDIDDDRVDIELD